MSTSRQININTFSQLLGKGFSLLLGFLTTIILRRQLGLDGFGNYIYILSFLTLFISFTDMGTHLVSVSHASQKKQIQSQILGSVFWLRLFISLLSAGLAFLINFLFFSDSLHALIILSLPLILLINLKNIAAIVFHSQLKLYLSSIQELILALVLFLSAIFLMVFSLKLSGYLGLMNLSYLSVVIIFGLIAVSIVRIDFRFHKRLIKKIFFKSLPLGMILILYTLYSKIDNFVLNYVWGSSAVGVYGLSFKIYENLVLPAAFFMNSLLPILSNQMPGFKNKSVYPLWQKSADMLLVGSFLLVSMVFFALPLIVKIFIGNYSSPETVTARILLLALPFAFLNHLAGYTIIALGKLKKSLLVSLAALFVNLGLNIIFIPKYSYYAAAGSVVLTQAFVLFFNLRIVYKECKFRISFLNCPNTFFQFVKNKGHIFDD